MAFPERLSGLPEYVFPRLRRLIAGIEPGGPEVDLSIGAPRHPFPAFVPGIIARTAGDFGRYPPNDGTPALREAVSDWIRRHHGVQVSPADEIMALNGTREGLFNAGLALCPEEKRGRRPVVLVPNPFYQVYAVSALAAFAEPVYVPATRESGFLPDYAALPPDVLDRAALAFVCSPSNPQGAVAPEDYLADLLALAEKHDFRVLSDECYHDIWRNAPPPGLLGVRERIGADPERALMFHSLSKRSNLPGLRSGFVAGGAGAMARIRRLRAYAGAPLPLPIQHASAAVWADERHVEENRALYLEKYRIADEVFAGLAAHVPPEGGFFLWLEVGDGEAAARELWRRHGIKVLPGAYLAREGEEGNPGRAFIRVAMVVPAGALKVALEQIRSTLFDK